MKNIAFLLVLFFAMSVPTFGQSSKKQAKEQKKQEQYDQILPLVSSEQYVFEALKANPRVGSVIPLTTGNNTLIIHKRSVKAELPYFGQSMSTGNIASGVIFLEGLMDIYTVERNEKRRNVIAKFTKNEDGENFSFTLTITSLENATLWVVSDRRQQITYTGTISEISQEE